VRVWCSGIWLLLLVLLAVPSAASAALLTGDLTGDGSVDAQDEPWLRAPYGSTSADRAFEAAADLNGDGAVDHRDLGLFGGSFGASGGEVDVTPPSVFLTLNDIPDDMNDLLVVPPERFQITLLLDSAGGSAIDTGSLSLANDQDVGAYPAGIDLGPLFQVNPTRAMWEIPLGSDLARTTHNLLASIADAAGNVAQLSYGFAVRDFAYGPPLGNPQTIFLDFDQDRSLGTEIDFLEDLRTFGLSSSAAPAIEMLMRDWLLGEIVARVHPYYGRESDASPGPDAANVVFVDTAPGGTHSRLCVGGQSSLGGSYLGAATMDVNNLNESQDECGGSAMFGIFPQALDNLWGGEAEFQASFDPLMASRGGTPVGEDPLDAVVTAPTFDPGSATAEELLRWETISNAVDGFAQAIASVTAHESGHLLGLVAHGPTPAGLYGGSSASRTDHNVTPSGVSPSENYLMNAGGTFSFDEMTGRNGSPLPVFRPLNWAYLRDRIALNTHVTGLFPAPTLASVTPNPASVPQGQQTVVVTLHGTELLETPLVVELITEGDPTPNDLLNLTFVDSETVTGVVNKFLVPPALYDVHLINADGQEVTLVDGLEVQ
jgi:hypothetical protein